MDSVNTAKAVKVLWRITKNHCGITPEASAKPALAGQGMKCTTVNNPVRLRAGHGRFPFCEQRMRMKTNNQYLIDAIKRLLERDDLADAQRIRLLSLRVKLVPVPKRRKLKAKPAPAKPAVKPGPFQMPAWLSSDPK